MILEEKYLYGYSGIIIGFISTILWITNDLFNWFGITEADTFVFNIIILIFISLAIGLITAYQEESKLTLQQHALKNTVVMFLVGLLYLMTVSELSTFLVLSKDFLLKVHFWMTILLIIAPLYVANKRGEAKLSIINLMVIGIPLLVYIVIQYF